MIRAVLAIALTLAASVAWAQPTPAAALKGRIGIDERLDGPAVAVPALERARVATSDLPIFVRLTVPLDTLQRASMGDWSALDERIDAYKQRSIPVLLAIGTPAGTLPTADTLTPIMRAAAQHLRGRVVGYQLDVAGGPPPDPKQYAFLLKLAAVQIRAIDGDVVIAQATARSADTDWLTALYADGIAPYVDLAPIAAPSGPPADASAIEGLITHNDPSVSLLWIGTPLGSEPGRSAERMLTAVLSQIGEHDTLGTTFSGSADVLAPALTAAVQLKDLLAGDLLTVEDRSLSLAIRANGQDVTTNVKHRVFYNVSSGGTYLVYRGGDAAGDRLAFELVDQSGRAPVLRDPLRRDSAPVQGWSWDPATKVSRMTARTSPTPLVLDFNFGAPNAFVSRAEVSGTLALSVEEIVARHQQAQATQANAFKTFIAAQKTELHFRLPTQVFDIVSDNRFFFAPDSVEWEELTFSVNGAKWGPDHPGLPLLQAEKVLTLPLDLRLTADYRYRLEGMGTVGERRCYVVAFEPTDPDQARYRGRVWIDAGNFLRIKVQSVQTNLEGLIVSNEETALYEPVPAPRGGAPIFLPARVSNKQILLIAGQNLLLEKEQWFSDFRIDSPAFETDRQQARASDHVMFRDTDAGVRYLVKRGAERVVSNSIRTTSKALAMGTTIDPAFAFPLPILGLNYLNFDVKGSGNQLAMLFAGVFILGNFQAPQLGSTPFDASVDFYGIAVPGTDIRFGTAGERIDERVLSIPMSTGANIGYQFTPFQKVKAGYALRYDAYFHAPDAEDFVIPSNTATHGLTLGYEYSRHGYRLGGSAGFFRRSSWAPWGGAGDFSPDQQTYRRHSLGAAKDFLFGPFQSVHIGAAWYGGARLDRFSMYQFGLFDEVRMHGVPAAGIRFPELVLFRGSYSFNIFGIYRLDLFVDHARGRDPNDRSTWRPVTGTGVAVTLKTPWNTMFTADIGKSVIPDIYRGTGSVVLQFMLLKPL